MRLLKTQVRASLLLSMQYRVEFLLDGFIEIFWMATALVPLVVVYRIRPGIAGWSFGEALLVMGWFTFLQGVLEGIINPSLMTVVEHVRKGTLDLVLIKPADAQFLVSTARFQPWRMVNVLTALFIFGWGFHILGRGPGVADAMVAFGAACAACVVLYSMWMLTICTVFLFVRMDNLSQLFNAIFDAARWPVNVFRGAVRFVFTFVIPLALMTTYPAQALLGTLPVTVLLGAMAGAVVALAVSRAAWINALGKYTSAGG